MPDGLRNGSMKPFVRGNAGFVRTAFRDARGIEPK